MRSIRTLFAEILEPGRTLCAAAVSADFLVPLPERLPGGCDAPSAIISRGQRRAFWFKSCGAI